MDNHQLALNNVEFSKTMITRYLREVHQAGDIKKKAYQIRQVGLELSSLAEFSIYLGTDVKEIKQWFHLAALAGQQEHMFWKRAVEQGLVNMHYEKANISTVSSTVCHELVHAILSDNWFFCQEIARNRSQITPVEDEGLLKCALTMFYLILDQFELASEYLHALKGMKKIKGFLTGYVLVLEGILTKNEILIEQGIARQIAYHKRYNKGSILVGTSFETTMLAKLSKRFGFQLAAFNSPVIHQDILYTNTDIVYANDYKGIPLLFTD